LIRIVRVTNPLQPSVGLEKIDIYPSGLTLEKYLLQHSFRGIQADGESKAFLDDIIVSLNGHVWPRSIWNEITPRDGDCIVISPNIGNGTVFKALGEVAIAAASIALIASGVGAGLGAALGVSTVTGNAILGGSISIVGNLAISAITSLLTPAAKQQTPTYAFDGPHSLAQSGTVIPKGYGTFGWGGNIISSFIDVEGIDQYLNVLVCFGFGPARSITDIEINGKSIAEYANVQYYTRLGSNDQTPIGNFNRIVNGYPQDAQCLAAQPVIVPGTGTLTQILQVDIQFPDGVFVHTNDGNIVPAWITYLVEYSLTGANDWQPVIQPDATEDVVAYNPITGEIETYNTWVAVATDQPPDSGIVYASDNGPHNPGDPWSGTETVLVVNPDLSTSSYTKTFIGEWQMTDPDINQVEVTSWGAGYVAYCNATTQVCYNRTSIYGLTPGCYDIRVTKYGSCQDKHTLYPGDNFSPNIGQDMWIHSVNEIQLQDLAYPNMVLIGVRALATGQLGGSDINVTANITHGLRTLDNNMLPAELQAFEEDNPACVAADMMLDPLYGGGQYPGVTLANINRFIDKWVAWAEMNDELVADGNGGSIRRHVFNGVFDSDGGNLWNQVNAVGNMSRAQLIPIGRDYDVFIDGPDVPVQIFTMGNMAQDSFSETWLELDARANQIEVQFADATRSYKQDNPIAYMDPAFQDAGVTIKNMRFNALGITIPAQAWHFARYKERCNEFLLRSGAFSCDVGAVACRAGNVIILSHDVPQWGWSGRTMPGSTASAVIMDRNDLVSTGGTSYSLVVLHPAILRYSGTVGAVSQVIDSTGYTVGTSIAASTFDGDNRITRAVLTRDGIAYDCAIVSSAVGSLIVTPPPGYTPATGDTYQLYDTDVLETCPVTAVTMRNGIQTVTLGTPLSAAPVDYAIYLYGVTGAQKLARVTSVRKASDFRAKIEWIDYDPEVYVDATPVIGETSAATTSNPGVTSLLGSESWTLVSGTYAGSANLSWKNGSDTVGVAIYAQNVVTAPLGVQTSLPQMVARLTNQATNWSTPAQVGTTIEYTVVGFDVNNNFVGFNSAPNVTIAAVGIAVNLLQGSTFQTGFAFWSVSPRAGDTFLPDLTDDGEAVYTTVGTALTAAQMICFQNVPSTKWAVGDYLMLSGYVEDTCVNGAAPNVGSVLLSIVFLNSSGATISSVSATAALNGATPLLKRYNTASTIIPAGTTLVSATASIAGTSLNIPVGSTVNLNHFLLEIATSGQTAPSAWADIDVSGNVLDIFTLGSSTGLRVQGSVVPTFTGTFAYTSTSSGLVISWSNLVIAWPDGGFTYVSDGSMTISGLTATTEYYAFLYFDIINGGVKAVTPTTPIGTPEILSAAYDVLADAACKQDGRVALTPGGFTATTAASGATGGVGGGVGFRCTVRGTELPTPEGLLSNEDIKARFDAGEEVFLIGREGPERILSAEWVAVDEWYRVQVLGFAMFGGSASLPLKVRGGGHRWCSDIASGSQVETVKGYRDFLVTRMEEPNEVLAIELTGPSHEYLVVDGVWTHNQKAMPTIP